MSSFETASRVRVVLPRAALDAIFDECDEYDQDETGGRVLGTYEKTDAKLTIRVGAIIDSGPQARRTSTSLFQDGEYQEQVFREIERHSPAVEHLGTWHTHHVNGFPTLSDGDIATYQRTVNHRNHNTDFFYAILVVAKHKEYQPRLRYSVKHYLILRNDRRVYEIQPSDVELVDARLVWTKPIRRKPSLVHQRMAPSNTLLSADSVSKPELRLGRVYDQEILADLYPDVRPYSSARLGLYWRGKVTLIDGSNIEAVVVENISAESVSYTVTLRNPPSFLGEALERIAKRDFISARAAMFAIERLCNRTLYEQLGGRHEGSLSKDK